MATKKPAPKKKAPAKKTAPVKKAAPVKKSAPAKKGAPSKKSAPAKKKVAPIKKAPVKKAPAKKLPAKKAAPIKKAVIAKPTAKKPQPVSKSAAQKKPQQSKELPKAKAAVKPATTEKAKKPVTAKPAPPQKPVSTKVDKKKLPAVSPETRFALTSKPASSPALIRKALREKEAKKEVKNVQMPKIKAKSSKKYEPEFTRSLLDRKLVIDETGPTQRYSDAELSEFKELVTNKLNAAKQELVYLNGLITRKDSMSGEDSDNRYMTMEDGGLSMEREQLAQMASRQIDFIEKLEKALMRIENKTYGICRVTGRLIEKARLKAVPHATLSMEAKMSMKK